MSYLFTKSTYPRVFINKKNTNKALKVILKDDKPDIKHGNPAMVWNSSNEDSIVGSVPGKRHNSCTISPSSVNMVAKAIEKKDQRWIVQTRSASDLIVEVGKSSFYLHKLPLVSKSGYLNRMVFQRKSFGGKNSSTANIQLENFPGGSEAFELVVKFCYGWEIELTPANVAPLYCAAQFLEMSDDLEQGNLISKTEDFLSLILFSSWKGTFQILRSCEHISYWARELHIVKRCAEAIAWMASSITNGFSFTGFNLHPLSAAETNEENLLPKGTLENWWFEDVSSLSIDLFSEVIESMKRRGMRSDLLGKCIAHSTTKWLSQITQVLNDLSSSHMTHRLQRLTVECLIKVLPLEQNSISCNFLLHILKVGLLMKIDPQLLSKLENRIASLLEQCCITDLLVKNYGDKGTLYDVDIVLRIVKSYISFPPNNRKPNLTSIGRLVEGFLTLVARDANLTVSKFQTLIEALPRDVSCHDNLYRAIDMYLKAHPSLTEEERMHICRAMEYNKLSEEAREHAMKNERMPVNITARYILLEQVSMTNVMTIQGKDYRTTNSTRAVIRVNKDIGKGYGNSDKEIRMLRKEVEAMKVQLNKLHMCKIDIRRQVNRSVI